MTDFELLDTFDKNNKLRILTLAAEQDFIERVLFNVRNYKELTGNTTIEVDDIPKLLREVATKR